MTRPRKQQIAVEETPYYHIVSRCVRRGFLCGKDVVSGKDYNHRRQWIEDRIRILSSLFAIDICSYAVMSNHFHLVVKLVPEEQLSWDDNEVLARWTSIFKGPFLIQKQRSGSRLDQAEQVILTKLTQQYRERLCDLGWFMKCLNEPIARQANKEDNCTGHFWEARYRSDPLFSEEALLTCMAYVDLNPIRAKMHDRPENSKHTSIKERIAPTFHLQQAIQQQQQHGCLQHFKLPLKPLATFEGYITHQQQSSISFNQKDYLQLVDQTGRIIRGDKRGAIPLSLPPIIQRLSISRNEWVSHTTHFEKNYRKTFSRKRQKLTGTG